jgi:hypothetical protein
MHADSASYFEGYEFRLNALWSLILQVTLTCGHSICMSLSPVPLGVRVIVPRSNCGNVTRPVIEFAFEFEIVKLDPNIAASVALRTGTWAHACIFTAGGRVELVIVKVECRSSRVKLG